MRLKNSSFHWQQCTSKRLKKISDENLLRHRYTNDKKQEMANNVAKQIKRMKTDFEKIDMKFRLLSNTSIPFFDIEYRTVLKIIIKNFDKELKEIPSNKEFYILNKNIHIFERLFGFKFNEHKNVSAITNQSFIALDVIYPEIKDNQSNDATDSDRDLLNGDEPNQIYLQKQQQKKSFHVFSEPSSILNDSQAFVVRLLD